MIVANRGFVFENKQYETVWHQQRISQRSICYSTYKGKPVKVEIPRYERKNAKSTHFICKVGSRG